MITDEWMADAINGEGDVHAFLMLYTCWKCKQSGWAMFLLAPYDRLVTETATVFKYPGIRHQFAEYMDDHSDIADRFGEIKERISKSRRPSDAPYLSHGCPNCDAIWGDHYLAEACREYFTDLGGRLTVDTDTPLVKHAFTVDLETVLDEDDTDEDEPDTDD